MNEKTIRKLLIDLGLSQTQLAEEINIPRNRINDAIAGRREGKKYLPLIILALRNRKSNNGCKKTA